MKKGITLTALAISMFIYILPSCYKNKEDILTLPKISFRSDVVPIIVAGGCGCHNNGGNRAVQFSDADTIFYGGILARVSTFKSWVNGGTHPGGGVIDFKANDKTTIQQWINEGAKDDGGGCTVTGTITYTNDISPLYITTCKGSTCHGGLSAVLDYPKLVSDKNILTAMMNSSGNAGHPGGAVSLSTCTINTINAWIAQGQPQ